MNVAILTISDGVHTGTREDRSGAAIRRFVTERGDAVVDHGVVPDEADHITRYLMQKADDSEAEIVLTTGGTGFAARDVTPEATHVVLDRPAPGIAEAMRQRSLEKTPMAALSRGVAGIRGDTVIVNLPGSPKAVIECLDAVYEALRHGVDLLQGRAQDHPTGRS